MCVALSFEEQRGRDKELVVGRMMYAKEVGCMLPDLAERGSVVIEREDTVDVKLFDSRREGGSMELLIQVSPVRYRNGDVETRALCCQIALGILRW